jgi:hypothetical protein
MLQINGREIFQKERVDRKLSGGPATGLESVRETGYLQIESGKLSQQSVTTGVHGKRGFRLAGPEQSWSNGQL